MISISGKTSINQSPTKLSLRSLSSTNKSIAIGKVDKANKRRSKHSIDQKNKRRKNSHQEATSITIFDYIEEDISPGDDHDEEGAQVILQRSNILDFSGRIALFSSISWIHKSNECLDLPLGIHNKRWYYD